MRHSYIASILLLHIDRFELVPEINNILVSGRKENKFYGFE